MNDEEIFTPSFFIDNPPTTVHAFNVMSIQGGCPVCMQKPLTINISIFLPCRGEITLAVLNSGILLRSLFFGLPSSSPVLRAITAAVLCAWVRLPGAMSGAMPLEGLGPEERAHGGNRILCLLLALDSGYAHVARTGMGSPMDMCGILQIKKDAHHQVLLDLRVWCVILIASYGRYIFL